MDQPDPHLQPGNLQTPSTSKQLLTTIIVAAVVAILASGATYIVISSMQNRQAQQPNQQDITTKQTSESVLSPTEPTEQSTADQINNRQTESGAVYSIKYPSGWSAKETHDNNYWGDQIEVTNATKSVVLRVLTGKQPYGYGGSPDVKTTNLTISLEGQKIPVKEQIVNNKEAYVDYTYKKAGEEYEILFGTGYPVGSDDLASLSDYNSSKDTFLQILSTLTIK